MSQHTPGPWVMVSCETIDDAHKEGLFEWCRYWDSQKHGSPSLVFQDCGDGFCTGLPGSIETTEANARLIAAAPDLLAELERSLPHIQDTEIRIRAAAVIAKAKGTK